MKRLKYELNELILKDSVDEREIPFVFMDGIAVQIDSISKPVPVDSPIILVYPKVEIVKKNESIRNGIEIYQGLIWNGSFYSIALKYGSIINLQDEILK